MLLFKEVSTLSKQSKSERIRKNFFLKEFLITLYLLHVFERIISKPRQYDVGEKKILVCEEFLIILSLFNFLKFLKLLKKKYKSILSPFHVVGV